MVFNLNLLDLITAIQGKCYLDCNIRWKGFLSFSYIKVCQCQFYHNCYLYRFKLISFKAKVLATLKGQLPHRVSCPIQVCLFRSRDQRQSTSLQEKFKSSVKYFSKIWSCSNYDTLSVNVSRCCLAPQMTPNAGLISKGWV